MTTKTSDQQIYDELSYYTLRHPNPAFIHQLVVDTFAAQLADNTTKPIKLTFALVGLYLHIERHYTGREVQLTHIQLAKYPNQWPSFILPEKRGAVTVRDVFNTPLGLARDTAIEQWCVSVWEAYKDSHDTVSHLVETKLFHTNKYQQSTRSSCVIPKKSIK